MQNYIVLTLIFKRKANAWTAECQEFGTMASGDSLEKAKEKIEEDIDFHLNALEEIGERKRFLKEHSIRILIGTPKPIDRFHPAFINASSLPRHELQLSMV